MASLKRCGGNCGVWIPKVGPSRCAPCIRKSEQESKRYPTREQKFYHTVEWKQFRAAYLKEKPPCRVCLEDKGVVTPARVCDHIVPIRKGGDKFNPENIQPLCVRCHNAKCAREMHEQRREREGMRTEKQNQIMDEFNQLGRKEPQ